MQDRLPVGQIDTFGLTPTIWTKNLNSLNVYKESPMASDAVKEFTDDNFDTEVLQADGPVLVDFWAPWCGPCRQIAPMIDELASENPSVKIGKVNIDDNPEAAQRFGINSIPTLLVFKGGEVAESFVGVRPKAALQQALTSASG